MDSIRFTEIQRFWDKVDRLGPDDCWAWTASYGPFGYGQYRIPQGKNWRAHRLAYVLTHGEIPEGAVIMHTCDNRTCVNPQHLQVGTQKQNLVDMARRGRCPQARLTPEAVADLRRRVAAGEPLAAVAKSYGIKRVTANAAVRGNTWGHITDPAPVTRFPRARKEQ